MTTCPQHVLTISVVTNAWQQLLEEFKFPTLFLPLLGSGNWNCSNSLLNFFVVFCSECNLLTIYCFQWSWLVSVNILKKMSLYAVIKIWIYLQIKSWMINLVSYFDSVAFHSMWQQSILFFLVSTTSLLYEIHAWLTSG